MRKNIYKNFVITVMTIAMTASLFAGCGKKEEKPVEKPDTEVTAPSETEQGNVTDLPEFVPDEKPELGEDTIAKNLAAKFKEEAAKTQDVQAIADTLAADEELIQTGCMVAEVEEGWLNGFAADEIKGFTKGVAVAPMIGSIPFIVYMFETDDVDALKATLTENAQLNWNICTIADEMVCEAEGNLVFFCMAPGYWE